jgi:hypothetical protein
MDKKYQQSALVISPFEDKSISVSPITKEESSLKVYHISTGNFKGSFSTLAQLV